MPFFEYQEHRVFYRDEGQGKILLILPGNTSSSNIHEDDISFFSKNYRVICPDYMGYGNSSRVAKLPTNFWLENARMTLELLNSLNSFTASPADKVNIVGTSGGGVIALNIAIIASNLVNCVVADSIVGEILDRVEMVREIDNRKRFNELQTGFWHHAHGEDFRIVVEQDSSMLLEMAATGLSLYNNRLSEIRCPVLLIGSLSDGIIKNIEKGMIDIARKIPDSKLIFYRTGDHSLIWSKKEQFRNEVEAFFKPQP